MFVAEVTDMEVFAPSAVKDGDASPISRLLLVSAQSFCVERGVRPRDVFFLAGSFAHVVT